MLKFSLSLGACFWSLMLLAQHASAQDAFFAANRSAESDGPAQKASPILADAYDFSDEPQLPEIDAPTRKQIDDAMIRGVDYLLSSQKENGAWGSPRRTKQLNIYAPVPGAHDAFRMGTTALALSALIETTGHPAGDRDEVRASIGRGEAWLFDHLGSLRRATGTAIYNVWGHAYSIQTLVRLHGYYAGDQAKQDKCAEWIRTQFRMLQRYESVDGGWGYYDMRYQAKQPTASSISFVNGTVLIAFAEARDIGIEPPARMVKRAIAATNRQRKPDFTYVYGEYLKYQPMRGINRPAGSLGRSQCCNAALRMWGDDLITDNVIKNWLYRLYVRNGWLDIGRKRPVPHEAWFQVAGYFYYYGHYYGTVSMELLPEADQPAYQSMLAKLMIDRQEKDGSWWDYPLYDYHQAYGTGFALMTLVRCQDAGPRR